MSENGTSYTSLNYILFHSELHGSVYTSLATKGPKSVCICENWSLTQTPQSLSCVARTEISCDCNSVSPLLTQWPARKVGSPCYWLTWEHLFNPPHPFICSSFNTHISGRQGTVVYFFFLINTPINYGTDLISSKSKDMAMYTYKEPFQ